MKELIVPKLKPPLAGLTKAAGFCPEPEQNPGVFPAMRFYSEQALYKLVSHGAGDSVQPIAPDQSGRRAVYWTSLYTPMSESDPVSIVIYFSEGLHPPAMDNYSRLELSWICPHKTTGHGVWYTRI